MHVQENVIGYAHLHNVSIQTNLVFNLIIFVRTLAEKKMEEESRKKVLLTKITRLYFCSRTKKKMTEDFSTFPTQREVIFLTP